jgi:hypothetical protein
MVVIDELSLSMKHVTERTVHESGLEEKEQARPAPPTPQYDAPYAERAGCYAERAGGFTQGAHRFLPERHAPGEEPFRSRPIHKKTAATNDFRRRLLIGAFVFLLVYLAFGGSSGAARDPQSRMNSYTPDPSLRGHQGMWLDLDNDGVYDAVGYDLDGDGQIDSLDTNLDGRVDSRVPAQQQQPYQQQRTSPFQQR